MRRLAVLTAGLVFLPSCAKRPSVADQAAVYRAALDTLFGPLSDTSKAIVAARRTLDPRYVLQAIADFPTTAPLLNALVRANQADSLLFRFDSIQLRQYFLDAATADLEVPRRCIGRVACDSAWAQFHARYPGSIGYIDVSRIGFRDSSAAVLVGGSHGYLNAEMMLVLLERRRTGWHVTRTVILGVS